MASSPALLRSSEPQNQRGESLGETLTRPITNGGEGLEAATTIPIMDASKVEEYSIHTPHGDEEIDLTLEDDEMLQMQLELDIVQERKLKRKI